MCDCECASVCDCCDCCEKKDTALTGRTTVAIQRKKGATLGCVHDPHSLVITKVLPDSPAQRAGIKEGWQILIVAGRHVVGNDQYGKGSPPCQPGSGHWGNLPVLKRFGRHSRPLEWQSAPCKDRAHPAGSTVRNPNKNWPETAIEKLSGPAGVGLVHMVGEEKC